MEFKKPPIYFPALTGVRALAAYLVFISHYYGVIGNWAAKGLSRFFAEFHVGVVMFFVLSGFLIAHRYYDNFQLSKPWFLKYLKNRIARIYPIFFLLTVGTFVGWWYFDNWARNLFGHYMGLLLLNLTLTRAFFPQFIFKGIGPAWSLTVEECFYVTAPIIFFVYKKYRILFPLAFLITLFGLFLICIFRNHFWFGFLGSFKFLMLSTYFGRCFEFFVGIKLALVIMKRGIGRKDKIPYTLVGFFAIFSCVYLLSILPIAKGELSGLSNANGFLINNYVLPIAVAAFFYGLLTEKTVVEKWLGNNFVQLLGKSSYVFYLLHFGLFAVIISHQIDKLNSLTFRIYDKLNLDWHSPFEYNLLNVLYLFIILNTLSILLFKKVEEPLNRYIRKSNFLVKSKV